MKGYVKGGDVKYSQSENTINSLTPSQWDRQNLSKGYVLHPGYAAGLKDPTQYKEYYNPAQFTPALNNGVYKWTNNTDPNYDFTNPRNIPVSRYEAPEPFAKPAVDPNVNPLQFTPSGVFNPNTGIMKTTNGQLIDPTIQSKKKGGLVAKVSKYSAGGITGPGNIDNTRQSNYGDNEWVDYSADNTNPNSTGAATTGFKAPNLGNTSGLQAGIAGSAALTSLVGQGIDASNVPNSQGLVNVSKSGWGTAAKDAGEGAAAGAAAGSVVGPWGTVIGGAVGAIGGGIYGGITGTDKAKANNAAILKKISDYKTAKLKFDNNNAVQSSLSTQLANRAGYSKGGKIVGKGTGTSDSIKAKVEEGSYVIPAKNAKVAKAIKEKVLGQDPDAKAELNDKNGTDVKVSNGEVIFSPEEVAEITANGIDLDSLAPESKDKLREHLNCGGMINEYSEGGPVPKDNVVFRNGKMVDLDIQKGREKKYDQNTRQYYKNLSDYGMTEDEYYKKYPNKQTFDEENSKSKIKEARNVGVGVHDNEYSEGGKIEIKPSHKGEFGAFARSHGMTTKQAADHVTANPDQYSPHVRKMATFAKNIAGLKKGGVVKGYAAGGDTGDGEDPRMVAAGGAAIPGVAMKYPDDLTERKAILDKFKEMTAKKNSNDPAQQYEYYQYAKNLPQIGARLNEINQKHGITSGTSAIKQAAASPQSFKPATVSGGLAKKVAAPSFAQESLNNTMGNQNADNTIVSPSGGLAAKVSAPMATPGNAVDNTVVPAPYGPNGPTSSPAQQNGPTRGQRVMGGISSLINYGLPVAQTALGLKYLKNAGARPVDQIDPEFTNALANAKSRASYGFTPEEQAQINNNNAGLTSAQRFDVRNYSGGSAGNAINNERSAINDSYGRGLAAAVQNRNLQLGKQQYADQLGLNKVELSRRLFNDKMNAWQQAQETGSNLVGAGVRGLSDANRYEQEKAFQQQNANNANNWLG